MTKSVWKSSFAAIVVKNVRVDQRDGGADRGSFANINRGTSGRLGKH